MSVASAPSTSDSPNQPAGGIDAAALLRHELANLVLGLRLHLDALEGRPGDERHAFRREELAPLRDLVDLLSQLARATRDER